MGTHETAQVMVHLVDGSTLIRVSMFPNIFISGTTPKLRGDTPRGEISWACSVYIFILQTGLSDDIERKLFVLKGSTSAIGSTSKLIQDGLHRT